MLLELREARVSEPRENRVPDAREVCISDSREVCVPEGARKSGRSGRRSTRTRGGSMRQAARLAGDPAGIAAEAVGEGGHVPVLARELIELLAIAPGQTAIDCTFGGGGHARLVAEQLGPGGTLIAIDRDPLAEQRFLELAGEVTCSVRFIRGDYAEALEMLGEEGVQADAVYFDLGMSSMQVDTRERGFSYSYDAPLDMRMDPRQSLSAKQIVAEWDERRLRGTLRELGEERHATAIARAIVRAREQRPIETTQQLVETITAALPAPARFGSGHPGKRVFQALRIAVNDELGQLDEGLPLAFELLREGGVLAAISFHSLEDRRVKHFLADRARGCICPPDLPICACGREPEAKLLSRRAIVPSAAEVASNPRAASARLRAARKLTMASGATA
ncbi:MAG TPA: 16S rRNA (cytosine(1402)-N(4))-methyltransferase RsmH [Solirubrobacteraceae bacterium]